MVGLPEVVELGHRLVDEMITFGSEARIELAGLMSNDTAGLQMPCRTMRSN